MHELEDSQLSTKRPKDWDKFNEKSDRIANEDWRSQYFRNPF